MLGKPVAHSLSPVLHQAAYDALGLSHWSYDRIEVDAAGLPALVAGLGDEFAGLSVTMPGKHAALALADEATDRARAVGAANTLVASGGGRWRADCTDVDGVAGALLAVYGPPPTDRPAVVLGAGGTAAAAAVALAGLGLRGVRIVVRAAGRAAEAVAAGQRVDLAVDVLPWAEVDWAELADGAAVVVSTVPPDAVRPHAAELARVEHLLDVIYHPWPTPLAQARAAAPLATGLDMLLHQAFGQVQQFTGLPAPREAMRSALFAATGGTHPLPLG